MNWKNFGDQKLKRVKQKVKIFIEIKKNTFNHTTNKNKQQLSTKKKKPTFDLLVFLIRLF